MDTICTVLGFAVVVAVLAIIGHGLWLLFASLFRAILGKAEQQPLVTSSSSPAQPASPSQQISQDLQAAKRLVEYAQYKDWLAPEQVESLNQLISEYSARTSGRPASSTSAIHPLDEPEPVATSTSPRAESPLHSVVEPPSTLPQVGTASLRRGEAIRANLAQGFMEQANIRWIELISASLIVVCSVGLVISLWSTLSSTSRYFPSLVFLIATAAVHGAGQYTLRKWKLRSTSRGILHIGLMLIPLAVLVGILLSVREGDSARLDAMTWMVLAAGTLVYGAAAVTASRSLFASRWLPVAAAVIVGGLTLVPIHFLSAHRQLAQPIATLALVPLVAIGLANILLLNKQERLRSLHSSGRARRMATHVLQVLFAGVLPIVFWITQSGGLAEMSDLAITTAGMLLAGWASWGWSMSNWSPQNASAAAISTTQRASADWLIVVAWGLALVTSIGLAAVLWQTSGNRSVFAGFLLALGVWWFVHGLRCTSTVSLLAGSVASILSIALFGEWALPNATTQIGISDWLSLSRVASIDVVSIAAGLLGLLLSVRRIPEPQHHNIPPSPLTLPSPLASSLVTGSGLTLLGTSILAAIASLVPWSEPAYGGNWAPLLLMWIGVVAITVRVMKIPTTPSQYWDALLPIGQAILLFGAVRLCQTAPMLPTWIDDLRPWRAWSVGTGLVALAWAGTAAGLRFLRPSSHGSPAFKESDTYATNWLIVSAAAVATFTAFTYWLPVDEFSLAISLGWLLPTTFYLSYVASRHQAWHEWSLLASIGWLVTITLKYGWAGGRWESAGLAASCSALAAILVLSSEWSRQRWRGWLAALVAMLAWLPWISGGSWSTSIHYPWQALWGATGVSLVAIVARRWLSARNEGQASEANHFAQSYPFDLLSTLSIDRVACLAVSIVSILFSGWWVLRQPDPVTAPTPATWTVAGLIIANFVLAILRLWDKAPGQRGLSVYLATIAATVVLVSTTASKWDFTKFNTELSWLCAFLGTLAVMAVLLRELIFQRIPVNQFARWDELATPEKLRAASHWMSVWHTIAGLLFLVPSVLLVIHMPEPAQRMAAIALPMLGAAAILPVASDQQRGFQRGSVLLLVSATLVLAWWADLPAAWTMVRDQQSWLFVQRAFLAFAILGWLYPAVAWRRATNDPWSRTLTAGGWICLAVAGFVGIGMVTATFAGHWNDFPSNVSLSVKLATIGGWGTLFARLLLFAIRPSALEQSVPVSTRSAAVYAGEVALALGGAATYQHFPHLFSGVLLQWWPLTVLGLAFASIAIGQLLLKADQPILADPIHRSSLLLPLIPLAGVWWHGEGSPAASWSGWGRYALLLATTASLYGLYGWMRNSIVLRMISALVALLSFWAFLLSLPNMRFFEHPQFWLLPPAIAMLIFVEWNRKRLDSATVTVVRYLCVLVAYLSSTAEVFFKSIEGNLWQPLFLLILALCGVAAAMVLRVRAFLYCGVTFIAVALIGMVRHASQAIDQVWPWWAFGIATGVGLIILLGYLEKNRPKVMKYLADLKQWQN